MAKLQEQQVGDKGVITKNYNALVRLASIAGRTSLGPGLTGRVDATGIHPIFRIDKSNNALSDADGINSTANLSGAAKRRTLELHVNSTIPSWDEWGLFDIVKLQTTGFRRYPYYDTLGSTTPGATTNSNESVGALRWDFPLVMLGSSTSKALAYARNSGTYPGLQSSATFLGTSTFIFETLHVEGNSTTAFTGGPLLFDAPRIDPNISTFNAFAAVARAGVDGVNRATVGLAHPTIGSRFKTAPGGVGADVIIASTTFGVQAIRGSIVIDTSDFEYRHNTFLGLTGGLGTSSSFSGGILIDRGDTDFPLSHGVDRLEWKLNGIISNGAAQDGLVPVQTSGCIQCVIITANERGNTGNNTFDINKHEPGASIAVQQTAIPGASVFGVVKPIILGNTSFKSDNAIRGFAVSDCFFDAGDFFSMDVDANTNARDVTVTMFVKYKSVNCDFGA